MKKPSIYVRCKGCNKKSTTTIIESKGNFYCQECRAKRQKFDTEVEQPKPSLFKRISDKLVEWFGSG